MILGFIASFIMSYKFNKKIKLLSLEHFLYSYIIFLIFFFIFAKILYIILDNRFDTINYILSNSIISKLKFVLSGYTFIGGYIGTLIALIFLSKLFKTNIKDLMYIYIPNMLLLYGILKLGCYLKNCCGSYLDIPIQLIESIINISGYILILCFTKKRNNTVAISLISFGVFRFILSLLRTFTYSYILIFIELFCLLIISYGFYILRENHNHRISKPIALN